MSAASDWLAQLQQQPWFSNVSQIFANAQVNPSLWEATLYNEDGSLNPAQVTPDHYSDGSFAGYSYGLFQLKQPGLGDGYTPAQLQDPNSNASIAATQMSNALKNLPAGSPLSMQLQAIEQAGWNGGLSQDSTRQAQLSAIAAANGTSGSNATIGGLTNIGGIWVKSGTPAASATNAAQAATSAATGALTNPFGIPSAAQISSWLWDATAATLCIALLAGGIAILAGSSAPKVVPV